MNNGSNPKILVTGAFGMVGVETINALIRQGYQPVCSDIETAENLQASSRMLEKFGLRTVFVDISDSILVSDMIQNEKPDVVIHLAAIVPPLCYQQPDLAFRVNVIGTQNLVNALRKLPLFKRLIYISSYSIHGPRNPYKQYELITADTALNPGDNYARHKVQAEQFIQASGIPWVILRLPSIFGLSQRSSGAATLQHLFTLPPERRQHALDARDAGLAICNAVSAAVLWRILVLGGATPDWTRKSKDFFAKIFRAQGLLPIPDRYYRQPDPERDQDWYYEDWVDTSESQSLLKYQEHTFNQYLKDLRKEKTKVPRLVLRLMAPLLMKQIERKSPYDRMANGYDLRTHWQTVKDTFGLDAEN
jgi:nucleoside-diphosphate-sugar epimerase